MCKPSEPSPLSPLEVERIVHVAAARVASRTRQDEDDLRAEARMRAPGILEAWSPALGVPPGVVLRRRLTWALYDISKRALRRARFHGSMPESDENARSMWKEADNMEIASELGVSVATVERDVATAMRRLWKATFDTSRHPYILR